MLLVEVAERLFAERGVNGVSLREIGAAAGQRNTGAARYHFGSKEGLVDAVFEHRMVPVNARREELLAELDSTGRAHELRSLTEAFLLPLSEQLGDVDRPSWYLRFSVQAGYVKGWAPADLGRQPWTRGLQVVRQRVEGILGNIGVPPALQADRWHLFAGFMAHALADRELQVQFKPGRALSPRDLFLTGLLDTAVALATAPTSRESRRLADQRRHA